MPIPSGFSAGAELQVAIRPERLHVRYGDTPATEGTLRLKAGIVDSVFIGNASQIFLSPFPKSGKTVMSVSMDALHRQRREAGTVAWIDVKAADIMVLRNP